MTTRIANAAATQTARIGASVRLVGAADDADLFGQVDLTQRI
jgi:hypothetical protein